MKYCVTINNKRYEVEVERGNAAVVNTTEIPQKSKEKQDPALKQTAATSINPKVVQLPEHTTDPSEGIGREVIKAPMAGGIIDITVGIGSTVKKGETLLLLEAMKMENEITAPIDGIVVGINVAKGASVSANDVLVVLK